MNKIVVALAFVAVLVNAKEEPFSIGLGVLSPSYSQTVGKENVKVTVEQKDNGFSYSVGDPKTGTNTYLNFGTARANQPSSAAAPVPAQQVNQAAYAAPVAPRQVSPDAYGTFSGYPSSAYGGSAGYSAPSYGSSFDGASGLYGALGSPYGAYPSQAAPSGASGSPYGAYPSQAAPSGASGSPYGAYPSQAAPSGPSGSPYGAYPSQGAPSGFFGSSGLETARKPEENSGQVLPAGFSYHGTEGQAFLNQGESPNFLVSEDDEKSARGPAQQSFQQNFGRQPGGILVNGLVGYGPGGPVRSGLPLGGYAGPQFSGVHREHGGHTAEDVAPYSG